MWKPATSVDSSCTEYELRTGHVVAIFMISVPYMQLMNAHRLANWASQHLVDMEHHAIFSVCECCLCIHITLFL
jgi:hypothetical protein